jgi:hypothetical protein
VCTPPDILLSWFTTTSLVSQSLDSDRDLAFRRFVFDLHVGCRNRTTHSPVTSSHNTGQFGTQKSLGSMYGWSESFVHCDVMLHEV